MATATSIVTGVDFVSVPTQNLGAAVDFYRDVLGLEQSKLWQMGGQEPLGAEFETGTVTIALMDCEKLGIDFQPNKVPIAFHVEDVGAARAESESRGSNSGAKRSTAAFATRPSWKTPTGTRSDIHNRYAPPGAIPGPRPGSTGCRQGAVGILASRP